MSSASSSSLLAAIVISEAVYQENDLCCTLGARVLYLFGTVFFNLFTGNVFKSKLELKVKSLELFSLRCDSLILHRLQADNSKFEFYPHTLTLTLTTETPINRAFQADCEGVRVIK